MQKDIVSPEPESEPETVRPFVWSNGLKFPNDPNIIDKKRRKLLRRGDFERKEYDTVLKVVTPDDTVLEIGAGMGYISTAIAKKKQPKMVHAYEANPAMIPYIESVYAANGVEKVSVTNALLGPKATKAVDFYVREDFVASSLSPFLSEGDDGNVIRVEKVKVLNINTVFKKLKPTVLVCDIEGAEADLLPVTDMSCLRAAVLELHPQWIGQAGVQAVFDAMHKAGLTYFPRASKGKVVLFKKDW